MATSSKHFQETSRIRPGLLVLALAVSVCLGFSALWLWTSKSSWKGLMLERKINRGEAVSLETRTSVWDSVSRLDQTLLTGAHVHFPGLAGQLLIMDDQISDEDRAIVFIRSREALENALKREPANTFAWARLAWFMYLQDGPSPDSLEALKMSIYSAPAKKSLLFWRISFAALHRAYWDQDFENLLKRQIYFARRVSSSRLAQVAAQAGLEDLVQETLENSPAGG